MNISIFEIAVKKNGIEFLIFKYYIYNEAFFIQDHNFRNEVCLCYVHVRNASPLVYHFMRLVVRKDRIYF